MTLPAHTIQEANQYLLDISFLEALLFKKSLDGFNKELERFPALKQLLTTDGVISSNTEVLHDCLCTIKSNLQALVPVKITLAFLPDDAFVSKLFSWFADKLSKECILDISVDPKILGGVLIAYAGLYKDLSLKTKVKNYFKKFNKLEDVLVA